MSAYWPKIVESAIVDSETYSDLEANRAPCWILRAISQQVSGLLNDLLNQFDFLCTMKVPALHLLPSGLIEQGSNKTFKFYRVYRSIIHFVQSIINF